MSGYEMRRGDQRIPLDARTLAEAEEEAREKSEDLPGVWTVFRDGQDVSRRTATR